MDKVNLNIVAPIATRIANKAHKGFVLGIVTVTTLLLANSVNGFYYRANEAEAAKLNAEKQKVYTN